MLINDDWARLFHGNQVNHLGGTCFDQLPLLIKRHIDQKVNIKKNSSFQIFGLINLIFMQLVEQPWNTNVIGNPMWRLQSKLKILSKNLSTWSRDFFGNVFDQAKIWEEKLNYLEEQNLLYNSEVYGKSFIMEKSSTSV